MRELKFRVWSTIDKQRMVPWEELKGTSIDLLLQFPDWKVMQFTGLQDKHGTGIYEGDILDFDEDEFGGEGLEVITLDNLIRGYYYGALSDFSNWRQIVGNIHENPDFFNESCKPEPQE